ncbi:MAG TPA: glycosyltransferase family 2 protein [Nitrospirales bacterium]|nr:glycosyltransferase family 2 protein [Nitrospirales bacterium]
MPQASGPRLSVVVPVYNERDNLSPLTAQILKALTGKVSSFEIIYVDDGSTDGSGPLLDELASYYMEVRVLHFDRNYGQTSAFDAGFHQAGGDLIATLDGDLQFDPADILTLLPLAEQYDLVCGWRKDRHDTLVKRLSSRIANAIRNAVIHDGVHDTGCSLKVFRRRVVERIPLFEGMHRFFPALARMHGFTVTEVPVHHFPRAHGQTKYGIGNRIFKGLGDLLAVRWMQRRRLRYRYRGSTSIVKR